MNAPSRYSKDRVLTAALFAAIMVAGGLSSQCRMVTDAASGSGTSSAANGAGNCMSTCAHAYAD